MASIEEGGAIASPLLHKREAIDKGVGSGGDIEDVCLEEIRERPNSDAGTKAAIPFMLAFATLIAFCSSYSFGSATGYSAPVESQILSELGLSSNQYSIFGSFLSVGGLIGAACCGKLGDLFGRRGAMWISDVFSITGWLAIAFAEGAWSLDLGRLLVGVSSGIFGYLTPIYIAEIAPKSIRGVFIFLNVVFTSLGVAITFTIGTMLNWRTLALLGAIPCLVQAVGVFFIPESPRWLANVGREKQLEASLQILRGRNSDISQEAEEIINYSAHINRTTQGGVRELFQRKYSRPIFVGVGLMLLQQFGGTSAYGFYLTSILESAGFPSNAGTIASSIVQFVMNITGTILIDKFGRRFLLLISAPGMCLASILVGLSFLLQDFHIWSEGSPTLAFIGLMAYYATVSVGMAAIPWVMISEIFPMNVKGTAGSFASLVNWSSSWVVSYSFNYLFEWSSAGVFFAYATVTGLGSIFLVKMVPETKGLTLEEIQASLMLQ